MAGDPELEPQVTIIRRETETIEEFRVKGRLTMVKVTRATAGRTIWSPKAAKVLSAETASTPG